MITTRRESSRARSRFAFAGATKAQAPGITIGMIYVGPKDDFGWNSSARRRGEGAQVDLRP